jgi:hypothetical protein
MTQFRLDVINPADPCVRLNQFGQITNVSHEAKCEFFRGPDPAVQLDFELFIKLVEL